ncbi:PAP2 superfamily C-terminal-domain-containing protein [Paraphysoderma sedebokerense]|nr:PAP2 superfamily C-terminal-domain-containing protein [Paraphysoderma sedebokerense]
MEQIAKAKHQSLLLFLRISNYLTPYHHGTKSLQILDESRNRKWRLCISDELLRTIFSVLFLCATSVAMVFCQIVSDQRWKSAPPLQDAVLDVVEPESTKLVWLADLMVYPFPVVTLLVFGIFVKSPENLIIWRRFFWLMGFLYFVRGILISVTTIPSPIGLACRVIQAEKVGGTFSLVMSILSGRYKNCTDMIFSGHTAVLVSCLLTWQLYISSKPLLVYLYLHTFVGIYFILVSRLHYTVDVILGVLITYSSYAIYFSIVGYATTKYMQYGTLRNEELFTVGSKDRFEKDRLHVRKVSVIANPLGRWFVRLVAWCDGLDLRFSKGTVHFEMMDAMTKRNSDISYSQVSMTSDHEELV